MNNYTVTHLHTEMSNGTTNIDSITKYQDYIDKAVELGMKSIAFTEHGNTFRHVKKRKYCKQKGIKYIHGVEIYITETLETKVRDNYHCCLYAKNLDGFFELNELLSHKHAFNRNDNHFYYVPRISIDELINTSDNIIITTACLGGILNNGTNTIKNKYIDFLKKNKHRCFIEIQHHDVEDQIEYNKYLCDLSKEIGVRLICGTDTHALNETHLIGRKVLQESKDIRFDNEFGWDLSFKSYEELIEAYENQNSLPMDIVLQAIENTNVLADMIEEYELDSTPKFPKLYDNPLEVFKQKINEGVARRGIHKYPNYRTDYLPRIYEEVEVYEKCNAIDYMLLQDKILTDAKKEGVQPGFGRGSVNGSLIAYIMGITEMDSIKWDLLFFRFMNPHRISLPDIDTDYSERDREWVMNYLFNMEGIDASLIITFNTIALKGAIRDVGRYMKKQNPEKYNNEVIDYICKCVDEDKEEMVREEYKDLFEFVDILNGTVVSIGSHPAGVVVSPISITKNLGTCMLADNDKPVTMVDMKEVDGLNFIKLDVLGLDTIGIINETCDLLDMDRITPDTVDIYDEKVWESIIKDTTNIFQMESDMAHQYLERITSRESINKIKESHPDIKMFDLFQLVCSMIRPGGANMRDDASKGICKENGIKELDDMLGDTLGYLLLQEQIMQFLVKFCNYTEAESDTVRRAIGKKSGTEDLLPEIERRFLEYAPNKFGLSEDVSKHIIKDTLQTILDCSNYSFSKNHNYPYSFTGYIAGYLRYYYPLEFATACLNTWTQKKKKDKINDTTAYIKKVGITIRPPKFRYSRAEYFMDKDTNSIYKGISSIKYLNKECAEGLYSLKDNRYDTFLDLLTDIHMKNISVNSRQMGILISIDYFSEFGKSQKLFDILDIFNNIMMKKFKSKKGEVSFNKEGLTYSKELIEKYSTEKSREEKYKQYKIEDAYGLCNELIKDIDNIEMPSINKIKVYIETMGECDYKFEDYNPCTCIVIEAITKYKTKRIKIYNIATGLIKELKIGEGIFNYQPLKSLDVIDIYHLFQKPKKEAITVEVTDKEGNVVLDENGNPKTKNKWIPTGEFETWCDEYKLYDEEDIDAINREEYEYIISLEEEK